MKVIYDTEQGDRIQWIIDDIRRSTGSCLIITNSSTRTKRISRRIEATDPNLCNRVDIALYDELDFSDGLTYSKVYIDDDYGYIVEDAIKYALYGMSMINTKNLVCLLAKDAVIPLCPKRRRCNENHL